MKLVFYSGGDDVDNVKLDESLVNLSGKTNPTLTFIPSSHYHSNEDLEDIMRSFSKFGIQKILKWEIDRPYPEVLKRTALSSDIIYLGGGNTFYFLKYLRKSGLMKDIKDWVKQGGILCGLSAGAILMTKDIETAGFPSFDRDDNDENIKNLNALDLVDFTFFPHYKNSKRYDQELMKYSEGKEAPIYACPDGSGVVIDQEKLKLVGKIACFFQGKKFFINKLR